VSENLVNFSFFRGSKLKLNLSSLLFVLVIVLIFSSLPAKAQIEIDDDRNQEYYANLVRLYAPSEDAFIALQRLIRPYIKRHEWGKAIQTLKDYQPKFPLMKDKIDSVIVILSAPEEGIKKYNMGGNINSLYPEYGPVVSPDGKKLFFTGRDREDGIGGEDIFISYYFGNRWSISTPINGNINTESNEYINSISADANTLLLFGNYEGSLGRGDNFFVEKLGRTWSKIQHYPEPINSKYWDADAFITADGKAIIFSSERPGNIGEYHQKGDYYHGMHWGNTDLWVVLKNGDVWSDKAINLGPKINTLYTERTPFLHPDGKTLYFSSDGHTGIGKSDVFKSVRLSDTSWTDWSTPVNLGKEINTAEEDWGYKITTDGKTAYFSTISDEGFGEEDIYYVDLPVIAKPQSNVFAVQGRVVDENGKPVDAIIKWEDVNQNKEVGEAKTDPETGEYYMALPVGKYYAYFAEVKGYYSTVNYLDLTDSNSYKEVKIDVNLTSIESLEKSGKAIKIENIFFDSGKYDLKEESYAALDLLFKFMKVNPEIFVEINAHTDSVGSDSYNQKLSENRANSVVQYLVGKGIDNSRLFPQGFGRSQPVASNNTDEGKALNRRVEFRLRKAN
jgi:outer membrane protein OmpA-like peptidoglycan-associated protein